MSINYGDFMMKAEKQNLTFPADELLSINDLVFSYGFTQKHSLNSK